MFITLLVVTFVIAFLVSGIVAFTFRRPLKTIMERIIRDDISIAWTRYIIYVLYVVGISSGVRVWNLKQYIQPPTPDGTITHVLDTNHWVLEVYETVIGTLQGIAWMLLVFFIFAMIAYIIVRAGSHKNERPTPPPAG